VPVSLTDQLGIKPDVEPGSQFPCGMYFMFLSCVVSRMMAVLQDVLEHHSTRYGLHVRSPE
jgi:hypothetical protein